MTDPEPRPTEASIDVEVRYAETDQMGVVHHAVYPVWCELARTRLCEQSGFHYSQIEELGYFLMVTGLTMDYRQPARYGDSVTVSCHISRLGSRGLTFAYELWCRGLLLARGTTTHVWLEAASRRPCRIPEQLSEPFRRLAGSSVARSTSGQRKNPS